MKRVILLCLLVITLTGCVNNKDKLIKFETVEALMQGTVVSIRPAEINVTHEVDGNTISEIIQYNDVEFINSDGGIFNIYFNKEVDISELHPETRINTVTYTVENETYLTAESFEITYQPTQYVVGITAEELISKPSNHNKQMSHIDFVMLGELDYKSDGLLEHVQSMSQTVRSDDYSRRYISSGKNIIKGKDINESYVNEYYVTNNNILRKYVNSNYTGWYYYDLDGEYNMVPDFTFKENEVSIFEYTIDDKDRVVVRGLWSINLNNFVGDGIWQLLSTYGIKSEDVECSFTATYDMVTLDLYSIHFEITSDEVGVYEDAAAKIKEFTATVYGIEYDKEIVTIPDSVKDSAIDYYYYNNPIDKVPELNVDELLCRVFLGTDKATIAMIKEYTQLDESTSMYNWNLGVEDICDGIKYWINNHNTTQFMEAYVKFTGNEEHSKSAAASVIYSWLQKYNIKIDDYREVPTE